MTKHDRELCRRRRLRELAREVFDLELANDIDREADDAAYHRAWHCFLVGPCSRAPEGAAPHEDQ